MRAPARADAQPAPVPAQRPLRIRDDAQALQIARELAADFARDAAVRDRERRLPWDELERFTASGLWAITVPREHGGAGVSARTLAEVIAIISAADGSLGQIPQNHYYALEVLRVGGTEAQKSFFYRRVLEGERFGNALAEIGHKDFKRRTRLHEEGGSLQVDGQKFYCTGALFAHWIPTLVVAQEGEREVTKLAFVPRRAEGVSIVDDWDGFGQRVTGSGSVRFEGCRSTRPGSFPSWPPSNGPPPSARSRSCCMPPSTLASGAAPSRPRCPSCASERGRGSMPAWNAPAKTRSRSS